jgi:CheY-like chemotaxis protein
MSDKVALVVDDTPANLDFVERLLTHAQLSVRSAGSGALALERVVDVEHLALAVVDMQLPDMDGLQLITELRSRFPNACLVIATMHDDVSLMEKAFTKGCDIFLVKPHGFIELFKRLTTMSIEDIRKNTHLVIDQYGPHPFRVALT